MGAAGVAMAGVSMLGTGLQAYAGHQAAKANKEIGDFNARISDMAAEDAIVQGEAAARDAAVQGRQLIGEQRASLAAQGIELGRGTAQVLVDDTQRQIRLEQNRIRADAARAAWGHKLEAMSLRQAGARGVAGQRMQTIGTLMSGGAQAVGLGSRSNAAPQSPIK